jgi:hypothetical protein
MLSQKRVSEQVPTYCQPAGQGIAHHPKLVPKLVPKRAFLTLSQRSWRQYLRAHRPHMTPQEATFNPAGRVRVPHGAFARTVWPSLEPEAPRRTGLGRLGMWALTERLSERSNVGASTALPPGVPFDSRRTAPLIPKGRVPLR